MSDPVELFDFRLAGFLGCSVGELDTRMSELERSRWPAYYRAEPFGFPREDMRSAELIVAVLAASGNKVPKKFLDVNTWLFKRKEPLDVAELSKSIKSSFAKGARPKRRRKVTRRPDD